MGTRSIVGEATGLEVVGRIEAYRTANELSRHDTWMLRVVLGVELWEPEVLGCRKRAGTQGASRVDLWCPHIENAQGGHGTVRMYLLRPIWTRTGWRLNDSGYLVDSGGTHELLYQMGIAACGLVGLDPFDRPDTGLPSWRVQDHMARYRETIR